MGATKIKHFTLEEKHIANIGRALAHPARIRIIEILQSKLWTSNIELTKELKLTAPSVTNHLQKLKDAGFVRIDFVPNYYKITLNTQKMMDLKDWTGDWD